MIKIGIDIKSRIIDIGCRQSWWGSRHGYRQSWWGFRGGPRPHPLMQVLKLDLQW